MGLCFSSLKSKAFCLYKRLMENSSPEQVDQYDWVDHELQRLDQIPYVSIYERKSLIENRGYFIPAFSLKATIVHIEQYRTHLQNQYKYTIELTHGPYQWTVIRNYADFRKLHKKLGNALGQSTWISHPLKTFFGQDVATLKHLGDGDLVDTDNGSSHRLGKDNSPLLDRDKRMRSLNNQQSLPAESSCGRERYRFKKSPDRRLPPLPRLPKSPVSADDLDQHKTRMQDFLSFIAHSHKHRDHEATCRFLEVSRLSFVHNLDGKNKEGMIERRPGGLYTRNRVRECCLMSFFTWKKSWLILKDSYLTYMNPRNQVVGDVLLFDRAFQVLDQSDQQSNELEHFPRGLIVKNMQRELLLKCRTPTEALEWRADIERVLNGPSRIWFQQNPNHSTYPIRHGSYAQWFVDGREFMQYAADMLDMAKEEIFVGQWWLTPKVYLKRPGANDRWRFDQILKRRAESGVKIFVQLYREVKQAMALGSQQTKKYLRSLHPNIKVLRHPHHVSSGVASFTHHEKIIIIDQKVAFVGGMDFCYGRWDDDEHRISDSSEKRSDQLWIGKDYTNQSYKDMNNPEKAFEEHIDRGNIPRMPWHDTTVVVYGSAAKDIARHFIQRWNDSKIDLVHKHKDYPYLLLKSYENTAVPELYRRMSTPCNVQILRCCGRWSLGVKETEASIHNAMVNLISQSKHYILIENPFFISHMGGDDVMNKITQSLFDRIVRAHRNGETFRVYIILPVLPGLRKTSGAMQMALHWTCTSISKGPRSLLWNLQQTIGDYSQYITFTGLRTYGQLRDNLVTEFIYIHSKLIIVDDRYCIISSANINDRSLMGDRDSEIGVLVEDTQFKSSTMNGQPYESGLYCISLRKRLMEEHLGLLCNNHDHPKLNLDVTDPVSQQFYDQWNELAKRNAEIFDQVFKCAPSDELRTLDQWLQREPKSGVQSARMEKEAALKILEGLNGHLVSFPLKFLSDSDLIHDKIVGEAMLPTYIFT